MTFSSLVGRTFATTKQGPRYGKRVERLIVHHCANTNNEAMVRYLSGSGGGTSATYCLTTEPELVGIVPEELRPWTSNAIVGGVNYDNDSNSVTVETVNLTGSPEWLVTDEQVELLAKLAADLCKRYGWGKLDRNRVVGHREVLPKGYTECPGPHLYAQLDRIVERGNEIIFGIEPEEEEEEEKDMLFGAYYIVGKTRYLKIFTPEGFEWNSPPVDGSDHLNKIAAAWGIDSFAPLRDRAEFDSLGLSIQAARGAR